MGDNNKKYSGFGYVVNPIRMWYNTKYKNLLQLSENTVNIQFGYEGLPGEFRVTALYV